MSDTDSDSGSGSDISSEAETTLSPVLEWYSKIHSRRVDIVGDYAGNELFLIEGDSILLNCFNDKHIDFDPGFQLLHATYAVENFLKGLVARRCNFHIAFFDQNRELCVPHSVSEDNREKYLLARAAIVRHLRANLKPSHPDIEIHVFPSVRSDEFAQYMKATDLYFIMCHDGASSGISRRGLIQGKSLDAFEDEDHETHEIELRVKTMYRLLIFWFMERGYNAALVNGLEWLDTKVVTTVLENSRHMRSDVSQMVQKFHHIFSQSHTLRGRAILSKIKSSVQGELTEREYLTVLLVARIGSQDKSVTPLLSALLRHTALLSELPLHERLLANSVISAEASKFILNFCPEARRILESKAWSTDITGINSSCDISDLIDGKLFAACAEDSSLGTGERFDLLMSALGSLSDTKSISSCIGGTKPKANIKPGKSADAYLVLPFSNSVFEEHLAPIQLDVDKTGEIADATSATIFREVSHWHNTKRPVDPKLREDQQLRSAKQQFFARRRNQWFMAEMMAYAASLTNAVGRTLEPEIVTTGAKKPVVPAEKKEENAKPKANPKGGKKGGTSKKQAIMAEIAASKSKKDEVSSEKLLQGWRLTCTALEKEPTLVGRYQKTKQYLSTLNTDLKREVLEGEVRLYMLNVLLGMWIGHCREKMKGKGYHVAALIFDTINSFSKLRASITRSVSTCLTTTIKTLELPQVAIPAADGDRKLAFTFALPPATSLDLAIPLAARQFQLSHCGPYFERSIDSAPDHRVPFEPDAWQRKVLDEIDAKRSLLVIAPTSAGKTFISFYAMQQVLQSNDDDILVYVAPTKALVNQIAAEVQGRFSKNYKYAGNSVWGIHTRDYRINNPTGCQILVTVPHILQIMLLAPANANSWSKRVKWIIFDEVHCIGQAEDGLIWEQLLLLAPCPIIALSATIGNPEEFNAWLTSTQKAIGNDLVMVSHPHRYSDLRKFYYNPPKAFKFEGLSDQRAFAQLGLDDTGVFTFLHPVASLINRARGMPSDLSFEARDCFMLWQSMSKHQTAEYPIDKSLEPSAILPEIIKKIDIIKWEAGLKTILRGWIADKSSPFEAVMQDLGRPLTELQAQIGAQPKEEEAKIEDELERKEPDEYKDADTILPLLSKLHEQDGLPGIIFNYDRGMCERICQTILSQLVSAETAWKKASPKWKATLQKWEDWKKAMQKAGKRGPPKVPKKKGGGGGDEEGLTKEDLMRDSASNEASPWASFNPDAPVESFHFADNKKMTQEELGKYMKELIRRELPEWLLDSLRRGVGVHHAGLNRKYRQVVEILFRKGYLRVIVATGTLALGINMPCKTVVFSGDSVFLTALNYRQAAGRAGRRGFDMLGNVVFHGISMSKIHRLISSRLPDLNGHFPITTTLVLRLFTLLDESKNSSFAVRSVNALLSQPRLYLGGEESKMTVLHHLRFSIEYLRRQYLLDGHGAPLNFAGIVSHLYFTENSAFAFHALLKDGFFHKLCANVDKNPETTIRELMLTMAHLFGRQYCRQADQEFIEDVVKRSPSIVFLPAMPTKAADILRKHNSSTLEIFTAYVKTFVDQHIDGEDNALPLTQMKLGGDSVPKGAEGLQRFPPARVRSSFVALSGHDDNFDSIHDLCTTSRSGVFLEEAVVPYVGLYPEESELPLNAYLYDFYMHGDTTALATANRIRRGDVWFVLNDFSMVLATIVTSLSNFMNLTNESDLSDIKGEGDEEEERQEDKFVPDNDSGYDTASVNSAAIKAGPVKQELTVQVKKKKKVADDWDDDADEEDLEAELAAQTKIREAEIAQMAAKPAWEEGQGLMNVLKSFKMLREEFDAKFRAMWA
ncbi:DEAD/DEAH box helicase-like protein [Pleomassaria siparia CBS 279.74]|uniref:DEAD/DEAH box helicase-like protein n=1 Tax=Pleomassaria siparia CBS 279.74 TaxID=1314801 RepID=A0A6G1JRC6_9PLEO|nr:DEAD/DEAH box helicase-like protein [Pleomassaria siparia CBS 279.74]